MRETPVLHLPNMAYAPTAIRSGRRVRLHYSTLCGLDWWRGDVADPGGDETLADCKRCLKIAAKANHAST
jgi:hypothetical protein